MCPPPPRPTRTVLPYPHAALCRYCRGPSRPSPQAPGGRRRLFHVTRGPARPRLDRGRFELRCQPLYEATLARRIPAFEHEDAALAVGDMRRLDALEPLLECDQIIAILAVIFGAVFIIGEFDGHRVVPLKSRRCYHSEGCKATRLTLKIGRAHV